MRRKLNFLALISVISVITYFSIKPVPGESSGGSGFVPLHLVAYFVLAAAFLVNFQDTKKGHLEAVSAAFLFGFFLELVQLNFPSRHFSLHDLGMNFLGASIIMLDHRVEIVSKAVELEDRMIRKALNRL